MAAAVEVDLAYLQAAAAASDGDPVVQNVGDKKHSGDDYGKLQKVGGVDSRTEGVFLVTCHKSDYILALSTKHKSMLLVVGR